MYTNLRKWIVMNVEKEYVNGIAPIPGFFHIGLNAQEVIIKKYFFLLSSLWKRVYPKSRTEFSITTMKMMPTMRKNFLGSLMNAWNIVKSRILHSIQSRAEMGEMLPVQWVSLHAMFVEFLPIFTTVHSTEQSTGMTTMCCSFGLCECSHSLAKRIMWIGKTIIRTCTNKFDMVYL